MGTQDRKRQKQLERRAAKRKSKVKELVRAQSAGLGERLSLAANCPVLQSWAGESIWDKGIGWACLARQLPNGSVAYVFFLIDSYCLGVKSIVASVESRFEFESKSAKVRSQTEGVRQMTPAAVRKLVESAAAFAQGLGFSPHSDYHRVRPIFGTIDPDECTERFEFGKDGKPLFVAGPYDSPSRCKSIVKTLTAHCGIGGFNYLMPVAGSQMVLELIDADFRDLPSEDLSEA